MVSKIVQSLWSGPWKDRGYQTVRIGWPSPLHYWASWAYSCLVCRRSYGRVELVADSHSADILTNKLALPYDKVTIALDDVRVHPGMGVHPGLFAFGKLVAYSIQEEPFFHVDADAYCFKRFDQDLLDAPVLAQNLEDARIINFDPTYAARSHVAAMPVKIDGWEPHAGELSAWCMGIFGGNDVAAITEYARQAIAMVTAQENAAAWKTIAGTGGAGGAGGVGGVRSMNLIVEQMAAYCYFRSKGITPAAVIPIEQWGQRVDTGTQRGFTHLMSRRSKPEVGEKLLARMQDEFPEAMEKVKKMLGERDVVKPAPPISPIPLTAAIPLTAPIPLTAARVVHGAVGIGRAIAGAAARTVLRQADPPYVAERHEICKKCPNWESGPVAGIHVERCALCGCATWAKIRNPGESCPASPAKWGAVEPRITSA